MREILFRGKRVKPVTLVSQWIYGNYVFKADNSLPGLNKHFIVVHDGFGLSQWIEVEPDTIGQYTGLKDKNGKMIFEGDIVKCKHTIHTPKEDQHVPRRAYDLHEEPDATLFYLDSTAYVYFRNYEIRNVKGAWVLRNGCDGHNLTEGYIHWHNIEIIGNIHDNPELMKEADR